MKKQAIIFGDSYSTFENHIPQGYEIYYYETPRPETDVTRVEECWWHQVMTKAGLELVQNNSWSGSTIGYTGYENSDNSATSSFIFRLRQLIARGFFAENRIDTVFVFGGTNDTWSNAPLGEPKLENWQEQELYCVLPAVCCFLRLLRQTLPQAGIYCLLNTELKLEIADCMKDACGRNGITPVEFDRIDLNCGHPTVRGMKDIADRVLQVMGE